MGQSFAHDGGHQSQNITLGKILWVGHVEIRAVFSIDRGQGLSFPGGQRQVRSQAVGLGADTFASIPQGQRKIHRAAVLECAPLGSGRIVFNAYIRLNNAQHRTAKIFFSPLEYKGEFSHGNLLITCVALGFDHQADSALLSAERKCSCAQAFRAFHSKFIHQLLDVIHRKKLICALIHEWKMQDGFFRAVQKLPLACLHSGRGQR